jgi:hypothetical protein
MERHWSRERRGVLRLSDALEIVDAILAHRRVYVIARGV